MTGFIEAVIIALIVIAVLALVVWLVFWVLSSVGVPLPAQVQRIVWIIFALVCILILLRMLLPAAGLRLP